MDKYLMLHFYFLLKFVHQVAGYLLVVIVVIIIIVDVVFVIVVVCTVCKL